MDAQTESCSTEDRVEQLKTARAGIVHQLRDAEELAANLRTQITMLDGALREYEYQAQAATSAAEDDSTLVRMPSRAERRRRLHR